ncbi:MAG: antibiotic biosynthesis monooxygenase [Bacteroidetes bacterium]|nr:antibiotic biosynthesis monooxygenase [Bacteroidota bacterium]MBK9320509.1 antibiotic biosynthesis monooxygenase [Bacteroidota bacterium]
MITRIVRLTIQKDKANDFRSLFESTYNAIRSFKGCTHLELFTDINQPNIFITFSKWESEQDLDNYRVSELFIRTWGIVKVMFQDAPIAFSMREEYPKS